MSLRHALMTSAFVMLGATAHAEPLKVVATFSIIGDFAKEVGGDRIILTTMVGPGEDAHVYTPKPADAVAMKQANVVLVNGLNFEGFLTRLVTTSGTEATIAELTKGIELLTAEDDHHEHGHDDKLAEHSHDGHDHGEFDPHAFQSATNAKVYVQNIVDAFCTADADGCDAYKANGAAYSAKLEALDAEIKATVAAIPQERRTIITSHDAFGYFARAYGIKFLAPEGISTDAEASAADVAALVRQVREDKASAIFVENISNPKLVQQIASETGLTMGGTLYSDALSDGAPAASYIDMMRYNAQTIRGAINGS